MKYNELVDFSSIPETAVRTYLSIAIRRVRDCLNSGIYFPDNMAGRIIQITFIDANTDTTFIHTLGKVPSAYMVRRLSDPMTIYDGSDVDNTWNSTQIVLRSDVPGTATIYIE